MTDPIHPLNALLRRYSFAYTASHDMTVCPSLMVDDYQLTMGTFVAKGRDSSYIPATEKQYRQYPGLGFTVHDLVNNGERAALRFSEHGRSVLTDRTSCWRGISMYEWDGSRLTQCRVEQDYRSRTRQIASGRPDDVPHPALDPWTGRIEPADAATESAVRRYLEKGTLLSDRRLVADAEEAFPDDERVSLVDPVVTVLDLFTAGSRAALHLSITGSYAAGLGEDFTDVLGKPAVLHSTGILELADGSPTGHLVTDRLALSRQLHPGEGRRPERASA